MREIYIKGRDKPIYFPEDTPEEEIKRVLGDIAKKEAPKGMVEKTVDWFKGGQREDFIPTAFNANLGLPADKSAKLVTLLSTTASDDRLEMGIKNILPKATFDKDQYGNLVVTAPVYRDGKETGQFNRFYPNPAGLDTTDVMIGSGAAALASPVAKGLQFLGAPIKKALGGAAIGATEAGLVEGVSSYLTGDDYQFSDLAYGAGGGAAGAKIGELLQFVSRSFKQNPKSVIGEDGLMKPRIKAMLTRAGLNPDQVTKELAQDFQARVNAGVDPTQAGRLSEASSLPAPIPLTAGQVTGSKGTQLFEDLAEKGAYGADAEQVIKEAREKAGQAIQENVPLIQDRLADGADPIAEKGLGGVQVQNTLVKSLDQAKTKADNLYTAARDTGNANLGLVRGDFGDTLRAGVRQEFNLSTTPMTNSILDDIDDVLGQGGDIQQLFAIRTQFNNISDNVDARAGQKARDLFDQKLKEYADEALISGDQNTVAAWNKAISNYSEFKKLWDTKGGILKALTEKRGRDGEELALIVAPERAANYILGASNNKLMTAGNITRDLVTLKKQLPPSDFAAIKQEAFLNLVDDVSSEGVDGVTFSGTKFLTKWSKMKKNQTAIKALFSPEDIKLINQFAVVSAKATGGAKNTSNSTPAFSGLIQTLFAALGRTNTARTLMNAPVVQGFAGMGAGAKARNIVKPTGQISPNAIPAGVSGVASPTDENRNLIDEKQRQIMGYFGR